MKGQQDKRLGSEAQEAIRVRVVQYLEQRRGTQQEAADIFMLSLSAVKKIWKRYKEQGTEGIKAHKRGRPAGSGQLSEGQVATLSRDIAAATPEHYDLPYTLWTAMAVRELIKKRPR